jgi:hypothetical protein
MAGTPVEGNAASGLLWDRVRSTGVFLKTEKGMAFSLLLFAIAFNAVFLWSEVGVPTFHLNDEVVHMAATRDASLALQGYRDPTDFWLSQIELGEPYFHYYQHLPQVVLAGLNQLTSFLLPLPDLLDVSRYLLMVLFPLSVFLAMRRFGFDYPAAGFSSLIASLLSTHGLYGFDYGSYIWRGFGLYTQLWAMFFLPLALAEIYRAIRKEGTWFLPVLLSAVVFLSSLVYAFILAVSAAVFLFLVPERAGIFSRFKSWSAIFLLTGLATSYFYLPILLDGAYLNRSIWEPSFKYDSYGAMVVLKNLFTGNLLDSGRLPVLTLFLFLATLFVIMRWKKENYRFLLLVTVLWLFLYFGRPTWGPLIDLLPFGRYLPLHRFIGGFHLGAILLTGAGLSLVWQRVRESSVRGLSFRNPLFIGIAVLLLLSPAYLERVSFYQENTRWRIENQNAFSLKSGEISELQGTLKDLPPGRVYAGLPSDFGDYPYYKIGQVPLYSVLPQLGLDTFGYAYNAFVFASDVRLNFDNRRPEQYDLFNIRYVLLHKTWAAPGYYSKIREFDDFILYRVPTTGYFELVDAPAVFYGNNTDFYSPNSRWLASSLPGLKENPIIELGGRPGDTSGLPVYSFQEVDAGILANLSRVQAAGGEILQENASTNEYRARFVANRDCYLMLKTSYHPGWEVTLDGREISPVMLAPGFIGVRVTPGTHSVLFSYRPPFYRLPLLISGILLLVLLGFYWGKISRKK